MKINFDAWQWAKLGIGFGVVTSILWFLVGLFKLPIIQIPFATLEVERTGLAAGLLKSLYDLTGLGAISIPAIIYTILGSALFLVLGAGLLNLTGIQIRKPVFKLTTVLIIASVAAGFIMNWAFAIPAVGTIITLVISSFITSYAAINWFRARVPAR